MGVPVCVVILIHDLYTVSPSAVCQAQACTRNKADSATTGTEPVVMAAIYDCDFSDTSLLYSPNIHSTTDQTAAVKDRIIPTEQLDAARDQLFTES